MKPREVFLIHNPDDIVPFRMQETAALPEGLQPADCFQAFRAYLLLAIARYSRGESLEAVQQEVEQAIERLEAYTTKGGIPLDLNDPDTYQLCLAGLSLSLLMGIETRSFYKVCKGQDQLVDLFLKKTRSSLEPVSSLLFPRPYRQLIQALAVPPSQAINHCEQFLANYYEGLNKTSWFNTHLTPNPAFFGFWSFELALVIQARDLDDTSFADNIFYPRDLVKSHLFRTWLDSPEGEAERQEKTLIELQNRLKDTKDSLSEFFGKSLAGEEVPEGASPFEGLDVMIKALGMDPDKLEDNPEAFRGLLQNMLSGMVGLSGQVVKLTDPNAQDDPELAGIIKEMEQLKGQIPKEGLDLEAILEDMPEDLRKDIGGKTTAEIQDTVKKQFTELNQTLTGLVEEKEIGIEQYFAGIDRLVAKYSSVFGSPITEYDAEKNARESLSKRLAESRKENSMDNFDWSSLWKKEDGSA